MKQIFREILNSKEAAALPSLLESGRLPALVSGLSAVHRSNLAAALFEKLDIPMLVVTADDTAAESFASDLRSMLNEEVSVLGMKEFVFRHVEAVSRTGEQERISALHAFSGGKVRIMTASVTGLIQRTIPREKLMTSAFELEADSRITPAQLEQALIRCGYTRTEQVEGPGQYSIRGGILDFFTPTMPDPVRMEFWGDEIDTMASFRVSDQRRCGSIERAVVLPAAETLVSLYAGGRDTLADGLESFAASYEKRRKSELARQVAAMLRTDAERIRGNVELHDADKYMPLIYDMGSGLDYIPEDAFIFFDRPNTCTERARDYIKQLTEDIQELNRKGIMAMSADSYYVSVDSLLAGLAAFPVYMSDAFTVSRSPLPPRTLASLSAKQLPSYAGNARAAADDVRSYMKQGFGTAVLAGDERRAEVLTDFLNNNSVKARRGTDDEVPAPGECIVLTGALTSGMEYPGLKLVILTDSQIIRKKDRSRAERRLGADRQRIESYADLSAGDYVVHESHGIGRFAGIVRMKVDGYEKDYVKINYAGTDCLYVPVTQLDTVTKYTGVGEDKVVKLSKMDGVDWMKKRSRAKGAAKEMAKKLIALYAARQKVSGFAFSPDTEWQKEFEDNFDYTETDDQLRCTAEIKRDMESQVPMDRLLCGDVGFGKTEVAMRAIMKCVMDGKQAAILVPTTVLAQQHYQTAMQRFFGFPVTIEVLNRFRTGSAADKTVQDIRTGACDLVIGTHRLLSKDIQFRNLGLLVVDEEQRFGVTHKEHIKELARGVDVLTLSATPIPRTLNMAMSGIRDMSIIEEPPGDRQPVQTFVMEHDWGIVADAIRRELQRGGQVYYLHNRIEDIERTARRISELVPEAVVNVAHGQMDRTMLSRVMDDVVSGQTQVLVCTTIIETGIDIPNVNTLIIEDADRLGLAQLHQIRGRVGRSARRASAYLTFRRDKVLTEDAEKRLNAVRDFAQFGSGIKIAMRDLEIRGAGNLLGAEQSGHMIDVGYDMYMKLLNEAVLEARGIDVPARADCAADLSVSANIPEGYISAPEQRMDLYRRIALIRTEAEADDIMDEMIDRFGDPPPSVSALLQVSLLRGEAGQAGITDIAQKNGSIRFTVKDFDMKKVSELYAMPAYNRRLRVEAGSKPCISLKISNPSHVIDEARKFAADWKEPGRVQ